MDYEIEVKDLEPRPTLIIRDKVARSEMDQALSTLLPRATSYMKARNLRAAGKPFVRYHSPRTRQSIDFDMEVGFPLSSPADGGEDNIIPGKLPGGRAIVTRYRGSYDGASEAYHALEKWIEENEEYEAGGAPWEVYLIDPEVADEEGFELEIVYPLQEVGG